MRPVMRFVDRLPVSERRELLPLRFAVEFDADAVAAAIGVTRGQLIDRMLLVLSRALAVDAAEMADAEMIASGRRMAVDGFPDGWPVSHLASVAIHRLFPERES